MKKIKNIQELKAKKDQLALRKIQLEIAIQDDWQKLKESLKPRNIVSQVFAKVEQQNETKNSNSIISNTISLITSKLTDKILNIAETNIGRLFK